MAYRTAGYTAQISITVHSSTRLADTYVGTETTPLNATEGGGDQLLELLFPDPEMIRSL